jgi:hypothetical protein
VELDRKFERRRISNSNSDACGDSLNLKDIMWNDGDWRRRFSAVDDTIIGEEEEADDHRNWYLFI